MERLCQKSTTYYYAIIVYLTSDSLNYYSRLTKVTGHFSAVAVDPIYEKQGVGSALVNAAEDYIKSLARRFKNRVLERQTDLTNANTTDVSAVCDDVTEIDAEISKVYGNEVVIDSDNQLIVDAYTEMGVLSIRPDLFPWYEKRGYSVIEELPVDSYLDKIVLDEYKHVRLILMKKKLVDE